MANERKTEKIVRDHFERYDEDVLVEEQSSDTPLVARALRKASKKDTGKPGRPEFIIQFHDDQNLLIVVECKESPADHGTGLDENPEKFAIAGAAHYARHLSRYFDVLAIAVSGTTKSTLKVAHYLQLKGNDQVHEVFGVKLLPPRDYLDGVRHHPAKHRQDYQSLIEHIGDLNKRLHKYKVPESQRALLICQILVALQDPAFCASYPVEKSPRKLAKEVVETTIHELGNANISQAKLDVLRQQMNFLLTSPVLSQKKHVLREIIKEIEDEITSFVQTHKYRDVIGDLYVEFLRYANSDKGLGIVLTPPHITEFFADLAEVGPSSVVFDNCAGTGGFLIAAMRKMIEGANGDKKAEKAIKAKGVIGVEQQPNIYSLAVSNMIIHQDGKSSIELGDCFDASVMKRIKPKSPTVGFLNPPYKAEKGSDLEELEFVRNNLECLAEGGKCVAIVPMQSALGTNSRINDLKEAILREHTLEAVLSMPDELFHNSNVTVVTCVMVFTAHKPHKAKKRVFFGYYKEDGFVRRRKGGRCDAFGRWADIKDSWLDLYLNRQECPGLSVLAPVQSDDDWIAERLIETDLGGLGNVEFERTLRNYSVYLFSSNILDSVAERPWTKGKHLALDVPSWKPVKYTKIFHVSGSETTPLGKLKDMLGSDVLAEQRQIPYVTTTTVNNGVRGHFPASTEGGRVITVDSAINGFATYQHWPFSASDHVEVLTPKFNMKPTCALFLVTLLNLERFRYNYGHKCSQSRMKNSSLRLPCDENGNPDWKFMDRYVKSLKYSSNLEGLPDEFPNLSNIVEPGLISSF